MTQSLVVDDADEDVGGELFACDAAVEGLVAVVVVAGFAQLVAEEVGDGVFFRELEGGGVLGVAVEGAGFARHGFDHLGDCHT